MTDEFNLIERIKRYFPRYGKNVIVGIGDDAAVIQTQRNLLTLATCDCLVEGAHFMLKNAPPEKLGKKAVFVNLSDIAAMGGVPKYLLVSLVLPKKTPLSYIDKLYQGIASACQLYNIDVVGGNVSKGDRLVIDVFLLGEVSPQHLIKRNGAQAGDMVLITGTLGGASASLHKKRFHLPHPRLKESQILAGSGKITAMIDLSDGLSSDIGHICTQGNVGVRLHTNKLPISPATSKVAAQIKKEPWEIALNGGEDYELCFTVSPQNADMIKTAIEQKTRTKVTIVGEILKHPKQILVLPDGKEIKLEKRGWNHFT